MAEKSRRSPGAWIQGRVSASPVRWSRWRAAANAAGLSQNRWISLALDRQAELEEAVRRQDELALRQSERAVRVGRL